MIPRDTSPEAHAVQREVHRRLGGSRRVELAFEMSFEARRIALAGIRHHNPDLSEAEARSLFLRRLLGEELYTAAYGRSIE